MTKPRLLPERTTHPRGARPEERQRERLFRELLEAKRAAARLAAEGDSLPEEERARLEAVAARLDEIREAFILANEGLVWGLARKMAGRGGVPLEDLVQAGWEGLIEAVDRFDPERSTAFSTYAVWHIMDAIRRQIATMVAGMSVSPQTLQRACQVRAQMGEGYTEMEIAAALGVTPAVVRRALALVHEPLPLEDLRDIADGNVEDVEDQVVRKAWGEEIRDLVQAALARLPELERRILALRYGLGGDGEARTHAQVGQHFGRSGEWARLAERRAREMLVSSPEGRRLADWLR